MTTADQVFARFSAASTDDDAVAAITTECSAEVDFVLNNEDEEVVLVFHDCSAIRVRQTGKAVEVRVGTFIPSEKRVVH